MKAALGELAEYASMISAILWMAVLGSLVFLILAATQAAMAYTHTRRDDARDTAV